MKEETKKVAPLGEQEQQKVAGGKAASNEPSPQMEEPLRCYVCGTDIEEEYYPGKTYYCPVCGFMNIFN